MSVAIDANVLLYASDLGSPHHDTAEEFLKSRVAGREIICFGWPTLMAYVRISTHSRIFAKPLSPASAMRNVETLLGLPQVRVLSEGERFWDCYREVSRELPVRGNLVPDAHLVALMLEHDVPLLYTNDADFKKFSSIRVRNPLAS